MVVYVLRPSTATAISAPLCGYSFVRRLAPYEVRKTIIAGPSVPQRNHRVMISETQKIGHILIPRGAHYVLNNKKNIDNISKV
jgi:hypothetical protein